MSQRNTRSTPNELYIPNIDSFMLRIKETVKKEIQEEMNLIMNNNNNALMTEIRELKEIISNQNAVINKLENDLNVIAQCKTTPTYSDILRSNNDDDNAFQAIKTSFKNAIEEQKSEEKEIERKKNNIIIFNIQESTSENLRDRHTHDNNMIKQISEQISSTNAQLSSCKRLGKFIPEAARARPLLISFTAHKDKVIFLNNARKLRELPENNVLRKAVIKPDMTKNQLIAEKKIVAELKQRRENGESNIVIRNGKIITKSTNWLGPPKQSKCLKQTLQKPSIFLTNVRSLKY